MLWSWSESMVHFVSHGAATYLARAAAMCCFLCRLLLRALVVCHVLVLPSMPSRLHSFLVLVATNIYCLSGSSQCCPKELMIDKSLAEETYTSSSVLSDLDVHHRRELALQPVKEKVTECKLHCVVESDRFTHCRSA